MNKTISVLQEDLAEVRAGRANPAILNKITVDYYGVPTPINQVAGISVPEARMILIQPWDMSVLKDIEKAITLYDESSNHGVIESSIELLNIYIDKYLEDKNKDNLSKISYYKDKILNSKKYNDEIKNKIEKILSKIEVNNEKDIYN